MKLQEEELRQLTLIAMEELGERVLSERVKNVVDRAIEKISEKENRFSGKPDESRGHVILTSFGLNSTGVVAGITKLLAEEKCNILDISQKIMDEFFTMIMTVDITTSSKDLKALQEDFKAVAERLNVKIYLQHEDLFRYMHRI